MNLNRTWQQINPDISTVGIIKIVHLTTSVVDPESDPHGSGTFAWIRIQIQKKVKEHIDKIVNSGLFVLLDSIE